MLAFLISSRSGLYQSAVAKENARVQMLALRF